MGLTTGVEEDVEAIARKAEVDGLNMLYMCIYVQMESIGILCVDLVKLDWSLDRNV